MQNGNSKKSIGEMGLDTRLILQKLLTLKQGDQISYDDLAKEIGREVRPKAHGYYVLNSARHAAVREGAVFGTIAKVGLKRLDDVGIVNTSAGSLQKIHRTARRGMKTLSAVQNFEKMPKEKQTQHNLNMSVLGVLSHVSSTRTSKRLEARVAEAGKSLPLARTLEECAK